MKTSPQGIVRHGVRAVALSKLVLPGDVKQRMKEPRVKALAESYLLSGGQSAEPIVVEQGTNKLVAGRDRAAAYLLAEIKQVDALFVSGNAEAIEALTLVENAHRRHNAAEQNEALARLVEMERAESPDPAPTRPGRPSSGVGDAIAKVAAVTGKTKSAVAAALHRAREAKRVAQPEPETNEAAPPAPPERPELVIGDMGLDIPDDIRRRTKEDKVALHGIHCELVKLQGCLTRYEQATGRKFSLLHQALHDAAHAAKASQPKCVCAWCKLVPAIRSRCIGCSGEGFLTEAQARAVTSEQLWAVGEHMGVFVDGRFLTMEQARRIPR